MMQTSWVRSQACAFIFFLTINCRFSVSSSQASTVRSQIPHFGSSQSKSDVPELKTHGELSEAGPHWTTRKADGPTILGLANSISHPQIASPNRPSFIFLFYFLFYLILILILFVSKIIFFIKS